MSVNGTHPPGAGGPDVREPRDGRTDAAAPMRVLALDPRGGTRARCAGTDGIPQTIEMALLDRVEPGAIVLVHAGVALARLDEEWEP